MKRISSFVAVVFVFTALTAMFAQVKERPIPRLVKKDGRYALFVDDAPYLILGAQVNNSSGWPGVLPKVWPAMEFMHANTAEIPVYWEQLEPQAGAVRLQRRRYPADPGSSPSDAPGPAVVRHLEERQPSTICRSG